MGGHGDGFGPLAQVPDPKIYKVEDAPQLKHLQERLAAKGLKDPWLRNEVWRYTAVPGSPIYQAVRGLTRGAILGIPAFLITLGIEHAFGISYEPQHEHQGDHNDGHH